VSTKTVAAKLQIKPDTPIWISHPHRLGMLGPLPEGADLVSDISAAKIALVFGDDAETVRKTLDTAGTAITDPAILWVAYPKANRTDINRDTLWPILTDYGMRPNGQAAIDDIWSALRFRPIREGEPPFLGGK